MLYQYKNFRTKEMIKKRMSKESNDLIKIVLLLIIINLLLVSCYYSEKGKYNNGISEKYSVADKYSTEEAKNVNDEYIKKNKIVAIINDDKLCSLCRSISYNNGSMKIECSPNDVDEVYKGLKSYEFLKQDSIEGDSSKFSIKLVLD